VDKLTFDDVSAEAAPDGLCACGCGTETSIVGYTDRRSGLIKGQRGRYIKGHGRRLKIDEAGRECGTCHQYKPWDQFTVSRTVATGHLSTCKPCDLAKRRAISAARRAERALIPRTCEFPGCAGEWVSRKFCDKHYERWRKYGDPAGPAPEPRDDPDENWLPIPTLGGRYEVSDKGRVYGVQRETPAGKIIPGQFLKPDITWQGYRRVGLVGDDGKQRHYSVHRLVLWAFTGENPPDLDTRHLDGNPANNTLPNLAFGTVSENAYDRVRHGTWVNNNRYVNATHCIHGHEFNEANTYLRPKGGRSCRTCQREHAARSRAAVKAEKQEAA
jgi:NUMOD4 motif/HNH endonuclease